MSATLPTAQCELVRLRQHVAWLNGVLRRLGEMQPIACGLDPARELTGRLDYARRTFAVSAGRLPDIAAPDRPPSLAALVVGQALLRPGEEQLPRQGAPAHPRDGEAVAWCDLDGTIWVGAAAPSDELALARGQVHVLWHWIEELGEWSTHDSVSAWRVPGMASCDTLSGKSDRARHFAWLLVQAGISIRTDLAAPDEPQVAA